MIELSLKNVLKQFLAQVIETNASFT